MMKTKKLLKTTLLFISAGVTCVGVGFGVVNAVAKNNDISFNATFGLPNDGDDVNQYSMSWNRIDAYQQSTLDKLAASTYDYLTKRNTNPLSDKEATTITQKQCGIFLRNINSTNPYAVTDTRDDEINPDFKYGDHSNNDPDYLNECYSAISSEANKLGVDSTDWSSWKNDTIPMTTSSYYSYLVHSGISRQEARAEAQNYNDKLLDILSFGQQHMLSDTQAMLLLAQNSTAFQSLLKTCSPTYVNETQMSERNNEFRLNEVAAFVGKSLYKSIALKTDNQSNKNMVDLLKAYSANGKYQAGSEIDKNDLKIFFNYKYNATYNSILNRPNFDYSNPDNTTDDYLSDAIPLVQQPLDVYDGTQSKYGVGEILPGYTLHVKIAGENFDSNSHFVKMAFTLGVSDTISDPNNEHVKWLDNYDANAQINSMSHSLSGDIPVTNIDNLRYIAQNHWYKYAPINVAASQYNSDTDTYYDATKDPTNGGRPYIDEILNKYCQSESIVNNEYDFKNHPMFIDPKDCEGIDLPKKSDGESVDVYDVCHTNQKWMLKVSDIDLNTNDQLHSMSFLANWAIVDKDFDSSNPGEQSVYDVHYADKTNAIWIQTELNPEMQALLERSTAIVDAFSLYKDFVAQDTVDVKKAHAVYVKSSTLLAFEDLASVVGAAAAVAFAIEAALGNFKKGVAAVCLVVFVGMDIASSVVIGRNIAQQKKAIDDYKGRKKALVKFDVINNEQVTTLDGQTGKRGELILSYANILHDPQYVLDGKMDAAASVDNLVDADTKDAYDEFINYVLDTTVKKDMDPSALAELKLEMRTDLYDKPTHGNAALWASFMVTNILSLAYVVAMFSTAITIGTTGKTLLELIKDPVENTYGVQVLDAGEFVAEEVTQGGSRVMTAADNTFRNVSTVLAREQVAIESTGSSLFLPPPGALGAVWVSVLLELLSAFASATIALFQSGVV